MTTKRSPKMSSPSTRQKTRAPGPAHFGPAHPRSVPIAAIEIEEDTEPDRPFAEGALDAIDPDLRHRMVSEAAYHLYSERGYTDGYDRDDWLQAKAAVEHLLLNSHDRTGAPTRK